MNQQWNRLQFLKAAIASGAVIAAGGALAGSLAERRLDRRIRRGDRLAPPRRSA